MNTGNSTVFDVADGQVLSFESENLRSPLSRINVSKPSGPRSSRRLLRKILRMRSALLSEF
jgi:hypothetical protein